MSEYAITFAAGAAYGATTVVVGQPLDTIKVRMQGLPSAGQHNAMTVGYRVFQHEGLKGLYRGGLPLFLGGSLMRSAQFGVSGEVKGILEDRYGATRPQDRWFGLFDWQVIAAGIAGGLGRGIVEIPTDYFKTRRQVENNWTWKHVLDGTGATLLRNTVLYAGFVFYIDLSKQLCQAGYVPSFLMNADQNSLTPFAKGAICANLAWLSCWPLDVVKTMQQSGHYAQQTSMQLLRDNIWSGRIFRGIVPGLIRSTIANGSSMVIYESVHTTLTQQLGLTRRDMT